MPERVYRNRWLDLRAWAAIQVKRKGERLSWWLQPGAQSHRTKVDSPLLEAMPGQVVEAWVAVDHWWTDNPTRNAYEAILHADGTVHLWHSIDDGPWHDHGVWT